MQALNADLPYDQFVRKQLAADQLPQSEPADLAALGFLGISPVYWKEPKLAPAVIEMIVADEWEERIDAIGRTFLGLSIACARCHDHKFDPISTEDYYALAGVLASTRLTERFVIPDAEAEVARQAEKRIENAMLKGRRRRLHRLHHRLRPLQHGVQSLTTFYIGLDADRRSAPAC